MRPARLLAVAIVRCWRELCWVLSDLRVHQPRLFAAILVSFTALIALIVVSMMSMREDGTGGRSGSPGLNRTEVIAAGSERVVRYVPYNGLANSEAEDRVITATSGHGLAEPELELVRWSDVIEDDFDESELIFGSDGSEGSILPLDNGVVPSSGPRFDTPWELILPSARISAAVVQVGLTPDGAMGSPDNPHVVGWFHRSAVPGDLGNALLGGHRDYRDRDGNVGVGVCWELDRTRVGDQLIMHDQVTSRYYVYDIVEIATIRPDSDDAVKYLSQTRESVVTLITCSGDFDEETSSYEERIIVVALLSAIAVADA